MRKDKQVTTKYLAGYFGVKPQTILKWRKTKGLPWHEEQAEEFGSRRFVVFKWSEVILWARENNVKVARQRLRRPDGKKKTKKGRISK